MDFNGWSVMHILVIPSEHLTTEKAPLAGVFQLEQAVALKRAGHQVGILSVGFITPRYFLEKYPYPGIEVVEGVNVHRSYSRLLIPFRFRSSQSLLKKNIVMAETLYQQYVHQHGVPDVIHPHNFLYAGGIAAFLYEKYGVPFVLTEHSTAFARGLIPNEALPLIDSICKQAKKLSCVSGEFKKLLQSKLGYEFHVLHNILNRSFYSENLNESENSKFTFINVALADEKKAQGLLIKAFAESFTDDPAVKLNIVGDGPLLPLLKDQAIKLGVGEQVIFSGRLSREGVRQAMLDADCFVLPSRYETFGVVLIEALASGLPLIATKCGGPEDIVNCGNGVLVEIDNVELLAEAMRALKRNKHKYDANRLREEAILRFGEAAFVNNVLPIYEAAIND